MQTGLRYITIHPVRARVPLLSRVHDRVPLVYASFLFIFFVFFSFHPIDYVRPSFLSPLVVTQIRGHIAGSFPSSPLRTVRSYGLSDPPEKRVRPLYNRYLVYVFRNKISALASIFFFFWTKKHSTWSKIWLVCNLGFVDVGSSSGRRYTSASLCFLFMPFPFFAFAILSLCIYFDQSAPWINLLPKTAYRFRSRLLIHIGNHNSGKLHLTR